jgi:hypothetical protein
MQVVQQAKLQEQVQPVKQVMLLKAVAVQVQHAADYQLQEVHLHQQDAAHLLLLKEAVLQEHLQAVVHQQAAEAQAVQLLADLLLLLQEAALLPHQAEVHLAEVVLKEGHN